MENSKRLRGRSRSSSNFESETSANIDITIEEPSNLNGDKNESDNKKDVQNDQAESLQQVSTDIIEGESSPDEKINDESVNTKVSEMKDSVTVNQENVKDTLEDTTAKNAVLDKIDIVEVTERNEEKKEVENPKEKVPKGRKRKISELKSLESGKIEKEQELQVLIKDEVDVDLYPSGTVEPLGKGKRARIPNKRYSDIVISPPKKVVNPPSVENGNAEKLDSGNDTDSSSIREYVLSPRSSTSSPSLYRTKVAPDLSDPKYAKPFKFGWKRELVWRGTYDESKGRIGDIYYYAPDGKKELIGIGGDKEIEREAKTIKSQDRLVKQAITKSMKNAPRSPKIRSPKLAKLTSPKLSSPKVASPRWSPKALHTKVELNETADSPAKQKRTPKNAKIAKTKTPLKKEVKKIDEKPISSRRGRKPRTTVVQKNVVPTAPVSATTTTTTTSKKRTIKLSSITNTEDREEHIFMENYLQNLSYGYNTLLYVFQYLKVQDLLRAGCVCTMWRDIAGHPILWKTVRMKNSQVHSFEGLANSLKKHCTKHLDLRKMLLPNGGDEIWPEFSKAIAKVETLRRIELCRCPASVVENLGASNPLLEAINAVTIKCESMNLEPLKILTQIQELRLKSTGGLTLTSNIDSLKEMKALKHLSLTSIRDLDHLNLGVIAELTNLESLDLGECMDFPKNFGSEILIQLKNLERLRLEKGQGNCHTFEILEAVKQMDRLDQLELVNFDIKSGFDKALGVCYNIRKLLIIPTYISQSATTNHMVLGGVLRLQKTLSHFVWGVTLELLRVTELFVDQCEDPKEKKEKKQAGNGDCIPVLKPVPLLDGDSEIPPALDPPQVEILALPSLQKLLMQNLPTTRVKILKIPFHATWRQSITDSVN